LRGSEIRFGLLTWFCGILPSEGRHRWRLRAGHAHALMYGSSTFLWHLLTWSISQDMIQSPPTQELAQRICMAWTCAVALPPHLQWSLLFLWLNMWDL
jgi:hypothetical protein